MEPREPSEWIEDFLRSWRSRYEGNRVLRVLAVAAAVLLVLLLALRGLRVFRVLAAPVLIGAILVVGWLLLGPLLTIPRISSTGPVVRNGVVAIVACGEKRSFGPLSAPEPRTGGWWPVREGECTTWYHRPPGWEQRSNRHQRAQEERIGTD